MAKVDGPLFSLEARGKIAEAIVFFPWKGRHVVRQWLKPTNPKSIDQGYLRAALKAIGKWIKVIACGQVASEAESLLYSGATDNVSAGTNWNAWLGEGFLNLIQLAHTLVKTSFDNLISEFSTDISTDVRTEFEDQAASLGMLVFAFQYGYTDDITPGLQLYFGAKACYMQSIIATSPWNVDPTTWDTSDVSQFGSYHTTDA